MTVGDGVAGGWGSRVWTFVLVGLVSLLIWVWAAAETRLERVIDVRVRFVPPDPGGWLLTGIDDRPLGGAGSGAAPGGGAATLTVRGSTLAVQLLEAEARKPFDVPVRSEPRDQTFNLAEVLAGNARIVESGVTVISASPAERTVQIDRIVEMSVPIGAQVRGLEAVQAIEIEIDPPQATVRLPEQLRASVGEFELLAALDPPGQTVEPGIAQQLTAKLQLPPQLAGAAERVVIAEPATGMVKVKLTAQSLRESHTLDVRVQIVGDAKNLQEKFVEIDEEDQPLKNVTITADRPLIRQIQSNEVKVFAVVQLSSTELQLKSLTKQPTFIAVLPDGTIRVVQGEVAGEPGGVPIINLKITPGVSPTNGS